MTAVTSRPSLDPIVPVMLTGARVRRSIRDALFEASSRAGLTPSEFALQAAAEKLQKAGERIGASNVTPLRG